MEGVIELDDGVIDLNDGAIELRDGVDELKDGTTEFRHEIDDIDSTLADNIQDKINEMMGTNFAPVSFVDERNSNVETVQFIIKTDAIELPEPDEEAYVETESLTFWQRFLMLFKRL